MEKLYDILNLTGAVCLIVFSVTGFALIVRWWNRLKIMEAQIRFIFEIENELLLKSRGQTPKRTHFTKEFFEKGEDQVVDGFPPESTIRVPNFPGSFTAKEVMESLAMFSPTPESETVGARIKTDKEFNAMLRDEEYEGNPNLPKMKNPPPPIEPKNPVNEY